MPHTLTVDFNKPIRLFPLAPCILLPHATVPLHIFEDRYRAMTRDALDSDGLIAMATFEGDAYKTEYEATPPIRPAVCVGYIVHHDRFADGRYNILLQGIARATVHEEVEADEAGYRKAILRPSEKGVMEIDLEDQRAELERLISDPYLGQISEINNVRNWLTPDLSTPVAIDLAWQAASRDSEQRYAVLNEPCVFKRFERLEQYLRRTRTTLATAKQMGPCTSDTGLPLN
ncbi:MAG: LON peptidase substrate-binding domain-containing protein [Phycisphaeraceae bacterium]